MKLVKPVGTSIAFLLLAAGAYSASAESEIMRGTYEIAPSGDVSVENVNGKISVKTWDGDSVKLEAAKSAKSQEGLDGIKVNVKSSGSRLEITTTLPKKKGWFGGTSNYGAKVDYVLQVPSSIRLRKAVSVNGHVSIDGVQGGVEASTVNGGIMTTALNGPVKLSTVNGAVKCETFTSSANDSIKISTVNGSLELKLPVSVDANLKAGTVNGSIKSDLAFSEMDISGRRKLQATIGAGGLPVDLSTVNGSIRVREAAAMKVSTR